MLQGVTVEGTLADKEESQEAARNAVSWLLVEKMVLYLRYLSGTRRSNHHAACGIIGK